MEALYCQDVGPVLPGGGNWRPQRLQHWVLSKQVWNTRPDSEHISSVHCTNKLAPRHVHGRHWCQLLVLSCAGNSMIMCVDGAANTVGGVSANELVCRHR